MRGADNNKGELKRMFRLDTAKRFWVGWNGEVR